MVTKKPKKKKKSVKKTVKKTVKKPSKKPVKTLVKKRKKKAKVKKSIFRLIFKWLFISMLWFGIGLFCVVLYLARDLPSTDDIISTPHKIGITVLAHDGSLIGRSGSVNGDSIHVNNIPPYVAEALISIEDRRFYSHFGIDPLGIARAMWQNIKAQRFVQGGSTITQQLAKNMFLSPDKTLERKVQEALLSFWLEKNLRKSDIISAYLNRVYFGAGAYGIDSASRTYFNKPVSEVSIPEAAMLVGLLKAPSTYSPFSNPKLALKRTRTVLHSMYVAGYLSKTRAKELSAGVIPLNIVNNTAATPNKYFVDWVINNIGGFVSGSGQGIVITTTFDSIIQQVAVNEVQNIQLESQIAFIAMTPNGAIRAMIGGTDYKTSSFNRATQALRQPGSVFKPFVYLTALMKGWSPKDKVLDAPMTTGKYRPKNFANSYKGEVTLTTAITKSLNTATIRMAKKVGIGNVIDTAKKAGINANLRRDMSLALGSSEVPLLEMTSAYASFANHGYAIYPFAITKIKTTDGQLLYERERPNIDRVFPTKNIKQLDRMLENVVKIGTGKRANLDNIGVRVRGKTGTSQGSRDAWFIGYTDNIVAGIWLGNDDNTPMDKTTGGGLPAQLWHNIMANIYLSTDIKKPPKLKKLNIKYNNKTHYND